ncbi:MAG TPA: FAD-dependent oxidoreductase [Microlunatus sp.]
MALPGKKKIAILGGGMAGLTTAYELTRTPELRALHDVTIYQLGWRLGGKAASGRDEYGRNLEHGLHVWFGCYANVFRLVQEVYRSRTPPPGCPLQTWRDVAKPQRYTPIGVETEAGWTYFPMTWPTNGGVPGEGPLDLTPAEAFETMCGLIWEVLTALFERLVEQFPPTRHPAIAVLLAESLVQLVRIAVARVDDRVARLRRLQSSFSQLKTLVRGADADISFAIELQLVEELLDITIAGTVGYLTDLWLPNTPLESIDDLDFRAWLIKHGGDPTIVAESAVTRIVYDTLFQYEEGDVERPSYAAGTALGVIMRLLGTFKGSMMWDIQTGMGEAVIAPLYEALVDAGVTVRFFRKVTQLELSDDGGSVAAVHLERQADTVDGAYRPTFLLESEHLVCWPSEPDWAQLENGCAMRASGVDFESHWCDWPAAGEEVLRLGEDFDTVVLAISMGAYKPLNDERTMCDALLAKGARFADFVNKIGIVPTQALQLWSNLTTEQLGWTTGKAATVSGPEYLDIWADMTQVLAVEPAMGFPKPQSLHYLCGTYKTAFYREPSTATGTPAAALADLRSSTIDWLNQSSRWQWPAAHSPDDTFRWEVLTDFSGTGHGVALLDQQFLRANIDPTECCVRSAAGTTQFRLHPLESGFDNLVLAGEATRNGFNTTAIEAATMSGMAASKAICGQPEEIVGYDFLQRLPRGTTREQP